MFAGEQVYISVTHISAAEQFLTVPVGNLKQSH